jgi:hypothetical protein
MPRYMPKFDLIELLNRALVANTNAPDPAATPEDATDPARRPQPQLPAPGHVPRRAPPRRGAPPGTPRVLRPRRRS